VLGSTIIGLEEHTHENIDEAIAHAVGHNADFHQFMLYTCVAGTPLYRQQRAAGNLLMPDPLPYEDSHGQYKFNFRHPNIRDGRESEYLLRAFDEDLRVNGPSIVRLLYTALKGWRKYRNHPERRIRRRFAYDAKGVRGFFPAALWATRRWFRDEAGLAAKLDGMYREVCREFGPIALLTGPLLGRLLLRKIRREARRLDAGHTYEPPTYYEHNYAETRARAVASL